MGNRIVAGWTADPSTPLRYGQDDRGWSDASMGNRIVAERTADPSTSLRSGRDDKGEVVLPWEVG